MCQYPKNIEIVICIDNNRSANLFLDKLSRLKRKKNTCEFYLVRPKVNLALNQSEVAACAIRIRPALATPPHLPLRCALNTHGGKWKKKERERKKNL